ncbi:MAG: GNAT family N-acetyltransferase [Bacteroidetes bacterium]|nr:GNAT family N-acetyltransferase [Bacteroidota bacterium]
MKIEFKANKKYSIIIDKEPESGKRHALCAMRYAHTFPVFLFNKASHLKFQPNENLVTFNLVNNNINKIEAIFNLFVDGNAGCSPYKSSFGSVEFDSTLSLENLNAFIEKINKWAVEKRLKSLVIKSYPFCYAPENSILLTNCFINQGYKIVNAELNQHIQISDLKFEILDLFHLSEKRRLKKCEKAGFTFQQEICSGRAFCRDVACNVSTKCPSITLKNVYEFVKKARKRQGHPLTMSYEALAEMFHHFPNEYQIFTVRDKENIAALTVTIKINKKILYNFYPADSHQYKNFSPMVMLVKGLYDHCVKNGFKLLDLGISTVNSKPNYGLINFKKNIGAENSLKLTFGKEF